MREEGNEKSERGREGGREGGRDRKREGEKERITHYYKSFDSCQTLHHIYNIHLLLYLCVCIHVVCTKHSISFIYLYSILASIKRAILHIEF